MTDDVSTPAIELRDIEYAYPDGTHALNGVNLSIARGERVALLGPNGAGKSTLILHINGIVRASSGSVTINGTVLSDETVRGIRADVGLVFQDPDDQLFMTTVYDDVAFGPLNMGLNNDEVDRRVHEALHAVGLADSASRPGQHLSFGQKKRVALATVFAMSPALLVLDEPTSNLDPRAKREMVALLEKLDTTLVVATHDMELAWHLCQRAVVVDGGRVVADGPSDKIMTDEQLLHQHGLELPPSVRATHGSR
ncbi:MAG: ATP-binding cassette domain-containing protein [Actinomycetota bacterium]|jgi:cobalt/nickel transport system ATP-binding protein|nr:ATP-binding cassette domain-containing protein [Actinomycetota bacterium]